MRKAIFTALLMAAVATGAVGAATTKTSTPQIGAQVFIEPGQSDAQIDLWFRTLKESDMTVARIRMFERYMRDKDGGWDFALFDKAFRAAEKYDIELYATLFPYTEFTDVGGFKFPRDDPHSDAVMEYINRTVSHFKSFKSLKAWVLINEPGLSSPPLNERFTARMYRDWLVRRADRDYNQAGYPVPDFDRERFNLWYHTWYLDRLAKEVRKYDAKSELHVNPHNVLRLYGSYDFPAWRNFLTTLGGSAHASWHFSMFKRNAYNIAMAANSEMLRSGAGPLPWLMTELQGGNNIFSGMSSAMMCPTPEETTQWLWTVMLTEGKAGIFWCLNPRASGAEAGEWALLNFKDKPSGRMVAAASVARTIRENAALLSPLKVVESGITILYNRESAWTETRQGRGRNTKMEGSSINSPLAYFEALAALGIQANLKEIREVDFSESDYSGKVMILSNQWAVDQTLVANLEKFVAAGGKLIVDGMSGYYDYNAHCTAASGNFQMAKLLGASPVEYGLMEEGFGITLGQITLPARMWMGVVETAGATSLAQIDSRTVATSYRLGKGEVIWIPSLVGLTAREGKDGYQTLDQWLTGQLPGPMLDKAFRFAAFERGVQMLTASSGKEYVSLIVNKSSQQRTVPILTPGSLRGRVIFAGKGGSIDGSQVTIAPEESIVIRWQ
ncbi:hypothetical protein FACS1894159_08150 [Bacteroidia bacterium]|nr:hypothetical protein FACS1894159_08150 [Bacteroidia bacterium]